MTQVICAQRALAGEPSEVLGRVALAERPLRFASVFLHSLDPKKSSRLT